MRKEYSDLSDKQKMIYIKRNIITFTCMFVPMLVLILVLSVVLANYQAAMQDAPKSPAPLNVTSSDTKITNDVWFDFTFTIIMILFFASMAGLIMLGSAIGDSVADRLNLYTDLELESAERRLDAIEKHVASEASIRPKEGLDKS